MKPNSLRSAQARLTAAQGRLREARNAFARESALLPRRYTTQTNFDQAQTAVQTAESDIEDATARLKIAQDNLSYTELKPDTPGTIVARSAEAGEVVQAGQVIFRLARTGGWDAVFDVPARLLRAAPRDARVDLALTDDPKVTAIGRVRQVDPQADPATRSFRVRVTILSPPSAMRLATRFPAAFTSIRQPGSRFLRPPCPKPTEPERLDRRSRDADRIASQHQSRALLQRGGRRHGGAQARGHDRHGGRASAASRPEGPIAGRGAMSGFNLSVWALRHRSFMLYCMIAVVIAGLSSYLSLGRDEDPNFTFRTMVVQAAWPGATVEETLKQVTERIERKLQETKSLDFIRSYTTAGSTTIFVNLKGATPPSQVPDIWYQVRKNIGDIRHTLPAGVVGPGFNDDFGDTFGIIYGFTADGFTQRELRDYVETVRTKLLSVPDVSKIELLGAQEERIFVEFSTRQLAGLGIDRSQVIAALQQQNAISPSGVLQTGEEKLSLRVSGGFDSEKDLLSVNILANGRLIRLRDIAEIRRGFVDPPQPMFRVNGHPAIGLAIAMRPGGDVLALGRNIAKAMKEATADLPVGIEPILVANQPKIVDHAIGDFMSSLVASDRDHHGRQLREPRGSRRRRRRHLHSSDPRRHFPHHADGGHRSAENFARRADHRAGIARRRRDDDRRCDDLASRGRRRQGGGGELRL